MQFSPINFYTMKSVLFAFFLVPFLAFTIDGLPEITKALGSGDITAIERYLGDTVEISLDGNQETYNKQKAVELLRDFFGKNKPKGFTLNHKGMSKGKESEYCIGDLKTATGTIKVYIYYKNSANGGIIEELRFD